MMTRGDRGKRRDRKSVIAAPLVIIKGARVEDEANEMLSRLRDRFNSFAHPPENVRRRGLKIRKARMSSGDIHDSSPKIYLSKTREALARAD